MKGYESIGQLLSALACSQVSEYNGNLLACLQKKGKRRLNKVTSKLDRSLHPHLRIIDTYSDEPPTVCRQSSDEQVKKVASICVSSIPSPSFKTSSRFSLETAMCDATMSFTAFGAHRPGGLAR
eukprot:6209134-Pleurochrysis_carterae.AAC.2